MMFHISIIIYILKYCNNHSKLIYVIQHTGLMAQSKDMGIDDMKFHEKGRHNIQLGILRPRLSRKYPSIYHLAGPFDSLERIPKIQIYRINGFNTQDFHSNSDDY